MNTKFISWLQNQTYAHIEIYDDSIDKKRIRNWMLHYVKKKMYEQKQASTHQILKYKWGEIVNKNLLSGWEQNHVY